jgi:hypothetical protein
MVVLAVIRSPTLPGREDRINYVAGKGTPEHFPEKWKPVFRRKCDKSKT